MAARQARSHIFGSYGYALMGVGVIGLFGDLLREAEAQASHLCFSLAGKFLDVVICLAIGEGRLLAAHLLDSQRLLDCYCMLASVVPVLHCLLSPR